ncbi:unnamed protein product [Ceratitis capitata]|uniref:(Mediterranean fruit fly) hypothetical protein n=1 Tax=Ceratitis capitata TaxID=7213 RepID=A0A811UWY6_CERCA|nr:unnamed protein product [Ceratitis capitata]
MPTTNTLILITTFAHLTPIKMVIPRKSDETPSSVTLQIANRIDERAEEQTNSKEQTRLYKLKQSCSIFFVDGGVQIDL